MSTGPDLTACDREPIHIPGSIQPHGLLLVLDGETLAVIHVAGDVETRLRPDWEGRTAADLLGGRLAANIARWSGAGEPGGFIGQATNTAGDVFDVTAHRAGPDIMVELEPGAAEPAPASRILAALESAGAAFERASGLKSLAERAAIEFRRITGFDRVMVYRFLDDDAGTVLAEDRDPAFPTFLNHHFPASDIPKQARALYIRNLIRVIPDAEYVPAPLRPPRPADLPLDMSDSVLRSVSPIHLQYLRNMGVRASASISIVKDGVLWGLIACHHHEPKTIPYDVRAACRALAGGLARQIKAKEDSEAYRDRIRLRAFEDEIVASFAHAPSIDAGLSESLPDLRRMLGADGVALLAGSTVTRDGQCPPEIEIRSLASWVAGQAAMSPFVTDELPVRYPQALAFQAVASGAMVVTISIDEPFAVLWFRAEQVEIVNWAGNPHKAVRLGPGEVLSPRASFDAWSETVRGRSRPWSIAEVEAATRLRHTLLDIRQQRRLRELNERLTETLADKDVLLAQQSVLIKEVNHRVQNSLALVSSFLALQGRAANDPVLRGHLDEAQRRLSAVALVHRRLYRADQVELIDMSRYLEELCADTVSSMGDDWSGQITYDIAPISVPTDRAVPVGLILTELVINANKYAYDGAAGPIEIALEQHRAKFRLIVADRGRGRQKPGVGFGTRMMDAMVAQLAGEFEYRDNRPGLRAVLTAPILPQAAS